MSKEKLLETLQEAMMSEKASAICIDNIISTFAWSGLGHEDRKKVIESLGRLATAPQHRANRLKKLIGQIKGGA